MRRMDESGGAYGEDPYGDAGHAYAYGHEYGAGVGTGHDVLELGGTRAGQTLGRSTHATGTLVIPADGYVALLLSTMPGGPGSSSPFVPQSDSTHPTTPRATAPDASPGTGHSAGTASPTAGQRNSGPAVQKTPGPTDRSAVSTAPAATSRPTAAPTRITSRASTAACLPTSTRKGRAGGLPQPSPHPGLRQPGPSKTPQSY